MRNLRIKFITTSATPDREDLDKLERSVAEFCEREDITPINLKTYPLPNSFVCQVIYEESKNPLRF